MFLISTHKHCYCNNTASSTVSDLLANLVQIVFHSIMQRKFGVNEILRKYHILPKIRPLGKKKILFRLPSSCTDIFTLFINFMPMLQRIVLSAKMNEWRSTRRLFFIVSMVCLPHLVSSSVKCYGHRNKIKIWITLINFIAADIKLIIPECFGNVLE